jgi:hypothetical protein
MNMKPMLLSVILPLMVAALQPLQTAQAGRLASLAVLDQNSGAHLKVWRYQGRNYIVGQPGQRYALQINNKTGGRLLAVSAVDGINVITGATASSHQSGYVLSPWQGQEIAGWRKNMHEVAAFYFTELSDSYAARTARGEQAGVIGVALYREQEAPPPVISRPWSMAPAPNDSGSGRTPHRERAKRSDGAAAESRAYSPEADSKLGTGHGERIESGSTTTEFRRASSSPAEVLTVYYDSYANLQAMGVIPSRYYPTPHRPSPFPGNFVPDPH